MFDRYRNRGYLLFNLGVLIRVGDSVVEQCSPSQHRVQQQPYAKTTLHKIRNIYTMHRKSPHAYKLIPLDVVIILKNFSARISCIILIILSCIFRLSQFLFVVLRCTLIQQWQKPMASVNFLNRVFKVSSKVTPLMIVRGHYLRYQTKL